MPVVVSIHISHAVYFGLVAVERPCKVCGIGRGNYHQRVAPGITDNVSVGKTTVVGYGARQYRTPEAVGENQCHAPVGISAFGTVEFSCTIIQSISRGFAITG